MINYIKGKVIDISNNYVILENSGIGYLIYTANFFSLNEDVLIYIYHHKTENNDELYGFKSLEQKKLFEELIKLKGIGCKIAINLTGVDPQIIYTSDIKNLQKYPKIGYKTAELIQSKIKNKSLNNDLIEALLSIGYKNSEITNVIPYIETKNIDLQIKEAILLLERKK